MKKDGEAERWVEGHLNIRHHVPMTAVPVLPIAGFAIARRFVIVRVYKPGHRA